MDTNSSELSPRRKLDKLAACCMSLWGVLAVLAVLLLGQYHAGVLHPTHIPFLLLFAATAVLFVVTVAIVVTRLVRGPRRWATIAWSLLAAVPIGLTTVPLIYAQQQWTMKMVPVGMQGKYAVMFGGSLMEAQAAWFYPERMESHRLVMFYRQLDEKEADIEAMDRHVADMEQMLGRPLRSKIHWVRGSLLGQSSLSFLGLALGSSESPAGTLDRHEIAHAVLTQLRVPSADPPMILHEGWAEANSGVASGTLAIRALTARARDPGMHLVDLLNAQNYRLDAGHAYSYGGAFVDFLIREFSVDHFVKIYNQWNVKTSEADFRDVYGLPVSALEREFWLTAEAVAAKP